MNSKDNQLLTKTTKLKMSNENSNHYLYGWLRSKRRPWRMMGCLLQGPWKGIGGKRCKAWKRLPRKLSRILSKHCPSCHRSLNLVLRSCTSSQEWHEAWSWFDVCCKNHGHKRDRSLDKERAEKASESTLEKAICLGTTLVQTNQTNKLSLVL